METKQFNALMQVIAKLSSAVEELRADMERGFAELRADIAEVRAEAVAESKAQAAVHAEILQAFNAPFLTLEQDHVATKTSHGKRISKLERHIS